MPEHPKTHVPKGGTWGTRQSKFNEIVDALRDANVPTLARSGASSEMSTLMAECKTIEQKSLPRPIQLGNGERGTKLCFI